jgi:DNA-binding CsgD family transcriptional regulator
VLTSGARFAEPGRPAPAVIALCRFPPALSLERAQRLAELHALPRREAELAIRVSGGASIAEAAEDMGLTLETARNYTKRIYARLGVRGQAELATLVCTGGAALG